MYRINELKVQYNFWNKSFWMRVTNRTSKNLFPSHRQGRLSFVLQKIFTFNKCYPKTLMPATIWRQPARHSYLGIHFNCAMEHDCSCGAWALPIQRKGWAKGNQIQHAWIKVTIRNARFLLSFTKNILFSISNSLLQKASYWNISIVQGLGSIQCLIFLNLMQNFSYFKIQYQHFKMNEILVKSYNLLKIITRREKNLSRCFVRNVEGIG